MKASADYIPAARALAAALGSLQIAGDDSSHALGAAQVNFELLQPGWCAGHPSADPSNNATLDVYFRDGASGSHGWMCAKCRKTTQTG